MYPEKPEEPEKSKPNDKAYLDLDIPIKIREETNEFLLEIYNWPAFFRIDYGLITLFNDCRFFFKIFFENNKQYEVEKQKERFFSFLESIIKEDHEKIKELIKINYEPDKVYSIKRGIEKLIDYFDLKSVENYFLKNNINHQKSNKINKILANTVTSVIGIASLAALSTCFVGAVSVPVLGGVGVIVTIWIVFHFNFKKPPQMDEEQKKKMLLKN